MNAGQTLDFNYSFINGEGTNSSWDDTAFISINGSLTELASASNSSGGQNPWKDFSFSAPTAGTYLVGIGVVNAGDTAVNSRLLVDNISEPGSGGSGFAIGGQNYALSQAFFVNAGNNLLGISAFCIADLFTSCI